MNRIITLISTIAFSSSVLLAQNFQFSGGYSISALVCSDGQVYSWGSNIGDVKNIGILGTNSTKKKELSPSKVTFPQGIIIKQIDAGSGTHFLAIDSDNYLWAWGDNSSGQTGQGAIVPNVTTSPKKVFLSCLRHKQVNSSFLWNYFLIDHKYYFPSLLLFYFLE